MTDYSFEVDAGEHKMHVFGRTLKLDLKNSGVIAKYETLMNTCGAHLEHDENPLVKLFLYTFEEDPKYNNSYPRLVLFDCTDVMHRPSTIAFADSLNPEISKDMVTDFALISGAEEDDEMLQGVLKFYAGEHEKIIGINFRIYRS